VGKSKNGQTLAAAITKRLLYGLLSLLFLSLVTFFIDEVAPGDAALSMVGEKANRQAYENARAQLGLDRPWPVRYAEYIGGAVRGDFGRSFAGAREPVSKILGSALPFTLSLAIPAILLAAFLGITLGSLAAINQGRPLDQAILAFSTLGVTLPNFVLAPILILILAVQLKLFPTTWGTSPQWSHFQYLALPVLVLSARPSASLTRLTRASMVEVLSQEFIKLARAKGATPWRLYVVHALRNAILPVITAIGTNFGFLLTGSFIVETIFTMPGMGFLAIDAINRKDTPVLMAVVILTGGLFILANLAVDLVLPLIDPRIREAQV
jgi:peptide/nickel transport system permease protein